MERKKFWRGLVMATMAGAVASLDSASAAAYQESPFPIIRTVQRADNPSAFTPTPNVRTFRSSDSNIEMTINEPAPPTLIPTNTPRPTSTPEPTSTPQNLLLLTPLLLLLSLLSKLKDPGQL